MDMIDEIRENAHIKEFSAKQRAARRYNSKVKAREMKEGILVLKQVVAPARAEVFNEASYFLYSTCHSTACFYSPFYKMFLLPSPHNDSTNASTPRGSERLVNSSWL